MMVHDRLLYETMEERWPRSRADAIEQLAALRAGTDGTVSVGGAALATQLLRAGLRRYAIRDAKEASSC